MGKVIKYFLLFVLALIILAAIGIGILIYTFNPNSLKGPISNQIQAMTGRSLQIKGNISWKFYPWIGISIHNVQLSNSKGFNQNQPFVSFKEADASLKMVPLFSGIIEFGKIKLDGLDVNLATNKNGQNNWDDLINAKKPQKSAPTPKPAADTSEKNQKFNLKPMDLSISSIQFSNANLNYANEKTGQQFHLSNFNLDSENISFASAFPVNMNFHFTSTEPDLQGQVSFNTKIDINQTAETVTVTPFVLDADLTGAKLPKNGVKINLSLAAKLDQKNATFDLSSLKGQIANLAFTANVKGINIFKNPTLNASLNVNAFNAKTLLQDLNLPMPEFASAKAFTKLGLTSDFLATDAGISVENFKLLLDSSVLKGKAYIALDKSAQSNFDFNLNQINLSNYLIKPEKKVAAPNLSQPANAKAKATQPAAKQPLIPIKLIRQLNLTGKFNIGKVQFNQLQVNNIKLNIQANDGIVKMVNNSAELYKGQWLSNIALNAQGNVPVIQVNEALNHVQVAELYGAFSSSTKLKLTGTADLKANVTTSGNDSQSLIQKLNGTGQFAVKNGSLKGVDVGYQLDRAVALVKKQPMPQAPANDETPFGNLTGTLQIKNGQINNQDLLLQSNALKVTGKGYVNLANQQLHYELDSAVLQAGSNPAIFDLQKKVGGSIPLVISGTLDSYKVYPNIEEILKNLATSYVKQNGQKIKQEVNKNLKNIGNELKDRLKGLFN